MEESIDGEIWKPIKGYEGYYEVSNFGRIRSLERKIWNGKGYYMKKGSIMNFHIPRSDTTQYLYVKLSKDGKFISKSVSVLVCIAFHGDRPKCIDGDADVECMHINGNSFDNRAENLCWGTHTQNMNEIKCWLNHVRTSQTKKTVIQYDINGKEIAKYFSTREAARRTGLNCKCIAKCAAGYRYRHTHGGYIWKYESNIDNK